MKIVTWNVNGIRAIMKKEFDHSFELLETDVICLQETKASVQQVKDTLAHHGEKYTIFANESKTRKGYSGTAILTKKPVLSVQEDMNMEEHDQEGRVIAVEFDNFFLVTVYTPNSGSKLKRLDYRETWDRDFLVYLNGLKERKPVLVCGDLNVAHQEIDLARPKQNYNKTSGYTQREIDGLSAIINAGFEDVFRTLYPDKIAYTYWNYMFNARARNVGWRIDYFLASSEMLSRVIDIGIRNEFMGSDHCPVEVTLKD